MKQNADFPTHVINFSSFDTFLAPFVSLDRVAIQTAEGIWDWLING